MAAELLNAAESSIASITLMPSQDGRFEVTANDHLIYSKVETGRHANPGEVSALFLKLLGRKG